LFDIEIFLYIPDALKSNEDDLKSFIQNTTNNSSFDVKINFVNELTPKTKIALSLVSENLSKHDKDLYENYQNKKLRFLFYYFQDIKLNIDDFNDEIFERIEFKEDLKNNIKLSNEFKQIEELKEKLSININESISDLVKLTKPDWLL
jgi:hypothetical protein